MREKGFTYREFEDMGYHLVVTGLEAKYYNSATYDDLITVRTRISELQSRGLTFHYMIYRDKTLLVEGITKHLCINNDKKPVVIPPHLLNILKRCHKLNNILIIRLSSLGDVLMTIPAVRAHTEQVSLMPIFHGS